MIASALAAIAERIPLARTSGLPLPSNTVIFQPMLSPASFAPAAGCAQPSAAWVHEMTQTFLPACGLGALAGNARSVPSRFLATAALASATTAEEEDPFPCDPLPFADSPQAAVRDNTAPIANNATARRPRLAGESSRLAAAAEL